jgi:hypothetical protein
MRIFEIYLRGSGTVRRKQSSRRIINGDSPLYVTNLKHMKHTRLSGRQT